MKCIICTILVLVMCLGFAACKNKPVQDATDIPENTPDDAVTDTGEKEEESAVDPKTIWNGTLIHGGEGFYDPEYDYFANERYKVCVFNDYSTIADDQYEAVFSGWCETMNIEFGGFIKAENHLGRAEEQLRNLAAEYDGIILRGDFEYRFSTTLNEEGCPWVYWGDEHRDDEGNLLSPAVTIAESDIGTELAENVVPYYKENMSDIPAAEIGVMFVTYSVLPAVENWQTQFCETVSSLAPELAENIVIVDTNIPYEVESFDYWYDIALQENAQYKYWLCCTISELDTTNAADAFLRNGLDNAHIFTTLSPDAVFSDSGIPQVKTVVTTPFELWIEPVIGALYGFMTGELTPDTIWGGDENSCGSVAVDSRVTVTRENYGDYRLKLDEYMSE
ncbi:MAG: hypothetical protein IJ017_01120 [Oscillospiraceae bacterium]|nr:hypothetical protein [Oscillospiraceae bacterium]